MKLLNQLTIACAAWLVATTVAAEPRVVASIKPIHSLVASVMAGVGEPGLIVAGAGSPHTYSLKPSQARDLERADVIFWVGHELEAFLEKPIETLGDKAKAVELGEAEGLTLLDMREGGMFEAHDHGEEHGAEEGEHVADGHGQDGHDQDGHAHEGHDHEGHDHEESDMHLWLDPMNAAAMVRVIAATLAEVDPENAARYSTNAEATIARLSDLTGEIASSLAPVRGRAFVVFHDAYHYFENRFDIEAAGSVTVSPEVAPGAERVASIRARISDTGSACVFAEPQFEPRIVSVIIEGTGARAGVLDPLGADLAPGPDLYPDLLRNLGRSLRECLEQGS